MKLLLKLSGFDYDKELLVDWDLEVLDCPKFGFYDNRYWGWIFYDKDTSGVADYALLFSEHKKTALPVDMFGKPFPITDFHYFFKLTPETTKECECGQKGVAWAIHSNWCPKWTN